eukprot:298991-Pelagomonas_calceolata.AAC.1
MGHYQHALGQITLSKDIAALPSAQAHDDEQKCVVGDVVKITSAGRFTYGCEMENDPTRRRCAVTCTLQTEAPSLTAHFFLAGS